MKLAYLVNQYPKISHSFIRREILSIESAEGTPVARMSVRRVDEPLVDPEDQLEAERTRVVLDVGAAALLRDTAMVAARRPARFLRALKATVKLGARSDRGVLRHLAYLAEACTTARWSEAEGVDHLHAHFGSNSAAVAMLTHELGGPSYSFTAHGTETFDYPPFIGIADKVANAAFVVAVSEYGRSQLCRWSEQEHWDKIHVVRCGADEAFLAEEPTPLPDEPRLVCVGRLSGEKGHLVLMQAAAALARRGVDFQLDLVGDGDLRAPIERFIADHGLEDRVRLLGWGSAEQVRDAIRASRALVLPSFMEGLPVVLMEAFALGRPAIATHVSGIPELVVPGASGWLVPAGAAEPLADAMQEVVQASVPRLTEMGMRGREAVRERHDADREARRLLDLFHRYAASPQAT
ncbi:MAG: glycosyltransferase family 4 protein [Myxococcales bacterium]|nr:glycosyltransferase family 4 protein [Myxococcales bacterium]